MTFRALFHDNNSISDLNNAISNGSTDINSSTKSTNERERLFQVQFEEKYAEKLDCSEGVKIQWLGGFVELQDFVSDVLDEPGKWNSPGGEAKSYRNSKIEMTWYYDRKRFFSRVIRELITKNMYETWSICL